MEAAWRLPVAGSPLATTMWLREWPLCNPIVGWGMIRGNFGGLYRIRKTLCMKTLFHAFVARDN